MANIYQQFKALIPDPPLLVGTVIAVQPGQCVIALPGGSQVTGRGSASLGQKVFIRGGLIEGQAPNLTVQLIEI